MQEDLETHRTYCMVFKKLKLKNPDHFKSLLDTKVETQNEEKSII
jgi:hypothetical protein